MSIGDTDNDSSAFHFWSSEDSCAQEGTPFDRENVDALDTFEDPEDCWLWSEHSPPNEVLPGIISAFNYPMPASYFCQITFPLALGRTANEVTDFVEEITGLISSETHETCVELCGNASHCLAGSEPLSFVILSHGSRFGHTPELWGDFLFIAQALLRSGIVAFEPRPEWVIEGLEHRDNRVLLFTPAFRPISRYREFQNTEASINAVNSQVGTWEQFAREASVVLEELDQKCASTRQVISQMCFELSELQRIVRIASRYEMDAGQVEAAIDETVRKVNSHQALLLELEGKRKYVIADQSMARQRLQRAIVELKILNNTRLELLYCDQEES